MKKQNIKYLIGTLGLTALLSGCGGAGGGGTITPEQTPTTTDGSFLMQTVVPQYTAHSDHQTNGYMNSNQIAYHSNSGANSDFRIANLDTGEVRPITSMFKSGANGDMTNDLSHLVYEHFSNGLVDLYVTSTAPNSATTKVARDIGFQNIDPSICKDENGNVKIAYRSLHVTKPESSALKLFDYNTNQISELNSNGKKPVLKDDCSMVAYEVTTNNDLPHSIVRSQLDGSDKVEIQPTETTFGLTNPKFDEHNGLAYFETFKGNGAKLIAAGISKNRKISPINTNLVDFSLSNDGFWIAYESNNKLVIENTTNSSKTEYSGFDAVRSVEFSGSNLLVQAFENSTGKIGLYKLTPTGNYSNGTKSYEAKGLDLLISTASTSPSTTTTN